LFNKIQRHNSISPFLEKSNIPSTNWPLNSLFAANIYTTLIYIIKKFEDQIMKMCDYGKKDVGQVVKK
jgi:hypothetical protein